MPILRQSEPAAAEQELTQAVRRVYERYGRDLDAFFRHVRESPIPAVTEEQVPESATIESVPQEHPEPEA
jgi:hypothetical protein